jgi:hypothetical protein
MRSQTGHHHLLLPSKELSDAVSSDSCGEASKNGPENEAQPYAYTNIDPHGLLKKF